MTDPIVQAYYVRGHGKDPVTLTTAADADALIDAMLAETFSNSVGTLYADTRPKSAAGRADHELRIALHSETKVGGIRYAGGDVKGSWYVSGQMSEREEVFYYYQGHDEGWPRDSEVSIDQVRQAVREFIEGNGARPTGFEWTKWPDDVQ
ncbi:Imm1 family immunity protein [Kribbella sp. NPDC056345]|uniref:Imm1 family immunity protein n=1 Tax=Kribbella sp. NPDC056345 TaxID=3345789 RepID=UPI0035DFF843